MRMFQLRPFIGQNGALASKGLTKHISMHPTITLCGRGRSIFSKVAEQSFTFLRGGQKTEVCKCFLHSAAFSISDSSFQVFFKQAHCVLKADDQHDLLKEEQQQTQLVDPGLSCS